MPKQMSLSEAMGEIIRAKQTNRLVLFVGAGVSANSGIPNWDELVRRYAADLPDYRLPSSLSSDDYLNIPEYHYTYWGESRYLETLRKFLDVDAKPNPIDELSFKLLPHHIVTTNFDHLLEDAETPYATLYTVVADDRELLTRPNNRYIVKMHGDLDHPKALVLRRHDFEHYEFTHPVMSLFLRGLLIDHTFVFIGYSLKDQTLRTILSWINHYAEEASRSTADHNDRPRSFLLALEETSKFEVDRMLNQNIQIINLTAIPNSWIENAHVPSELQHKGGANTYALLKCVDDPRNLTSCGQVDSVIELQCSDLMAYDKISWTDLKAVFPFEIQSIGVPSATNSSGQRTTFPGPFLWLERSQDFETLQRVCSESSSFTSVLLRRAGIAGFGSVEGEVTYQVLKDIEWTHARDIELWLENRYDDLFEYVTAKDDTAMWTVYKQLFEKAPVIPSADQPRPRVASEALGTLKLSLNTIREILSNDSAFDLDSQELFDIYKALREQYHDSVKFLGYLIAHPSNSMVLAAQKELKDELDRSDPNNKAVRLYATPIPIEKLRAFAYDYYSFMLGNRLRSPFMNCRELVSFYVQALMGQSRLSRKENDGPRSAMHMTTNAEAPFLNELDVDILTKFTDTRELFRWISDYKVENLRVDPEMILDRLMNLFCSGHLKNNFFCKFANNLLTILQITQLDETELGSVQHQGIQSVCARLQECTGAIDAGELLESLTTLTRLETPDQTDIQLILRTMQSYMSKFSPASEDKFGLIWHDQEQIRSVCTAISEYVTDQDKLTMQQEIGTKPGSQRLWWILACRPVLPTEFVASCIPFCNPQTAFELCQEGYAEPDENLGRRLIMALREHTRQHAGRIVLGDGYNLLLMCLIVVAHYRVLPVSVLEPFRELSDHIDFLLDPDSFDYSRVDLRDAGWHILLQSEPASSILQKHANVIDTSVLRRHIEADRATQHELSLARVLGLIPESPDVDQDSSTGLSSVAE